jgi:hypothetical protein
MDLAGSIPQRRIKSLNSTPLATARARLTADWVVICCGWMRTSLMDACCKPLLSAVVTHVALG